MNYFITTLNGRVIQIGSTSQNNLDLYTTKTSKTYEGIAKLDEYYLDGIVHPLPPKPSEYHIFNYDTKEWEDPRTLQDLKDQKWKEIKQQRTLAEGSGFTWDSSTFDSDPVSQTRLAGAAQLASIAIQSNIPYQVTWTLKDNSHRELLAQDIINVVLALGQHIQAQFNKGQLIQQQLEGATTKELVENIKW